MKKNSKKMERFQNIYQALEPFRVAKKNTIHSLACIGRKHKWLKYPMLIGLTAFVFLYNLFLYMCIGLKMREKMAKSIALIMVAVLLVTSVDITAFAMRGDKEDYYKVAAVTEELAMVEVPHGTDVSELGLPLEVAVLLEYYTYDEQDVPGTDVSGNTPIPEAGVSANTPAPEVNVSANTPTSEVSVSANAPTSEVSVSANTQTPEVGVSANAPTSEKDLGADVKVEDEQAESIRTETVELEPIYATVDISANMVNVLVAESVETDAGDAGAVVIEGEAEETTEEFCAGTMNAVLPITWECADFDSEVAGEYRFVGNFAKEYNGLDVIAEESLQPVIVVKVLPEQMMILTQTVGAVEVTLTAQPGVFPVGAMLSVTKIEDVATIEKIENAIQNSLDETAEEDAEHSMVKNTITFDIKVLDADGNELQPEIPEGMSTEEAVVVSFRQIVPLLETEYDEQEEYCNMEVFYVDDSYETAEAVTTNVDGENVSFSPEHFSNYSCSCYVSSAKYVYSWKQLYKAVYNKSGTIRVKLGNDIDISRLTLYSNSSRLYINNGQTVMLELNGYELRNKADGYPAIDVRNGTLEIHDYWGGGVISAPYDSEVIYVSGSNAKVVLAGGTILKTGEPSYGVYVTNSGTFSMTGGRISGEFSKGIYVSSSGTNKVSLSGGEINGSKYGIYAAGSTYRSTTVNMSGGTIKNYRYYGIYNTNAAATITGGYLYGNSSYNAYGIYNSGNGSLKIGGNVNFANNRSGDIYVGANVGNRIQITSALTGTKIGVVTGTTPTEESPVRFTTNATSKDKFYSAANSSYAVRQEGGTNYLVVGPKANCTINVKPQNVKVNPADDAIAGTVSIDNGTASTTQLTTLVKYNSPITLRATLTDSANYEFTGWKNLNGVIVSTDATYTFAAQNDDTYTAVFTKKKVTVSVESSLNSRGSVAITAYSLNGSMSSCTSGTFEVGSTITIKATPLGNYLFFQWNDGNTDAQRTITVTEGKTYIAQFKNPPPSETATGEFFTGVTPIDLGANLPSVGDKLLLVGGGEEMTVTDGGYLAVAGLPADSARVTVKGTGAKSGDTLWKDWYGNVGVGPIVGTGGIYLSVDPIPESEKYKYPGKTHYSGDDFDTCLGGLINRVSTTGNVWRYWCDGSAKQGIGPYTVYKYDTCSTFVAGNISADFNSIVYSEDRTTVESINLDVYVTVDKGTENEKTYTLVNLIYYDEAIDYVNGDKIVELNLDNVLFTYQLPEATIERVLVDETTGEALTDPETGEMLTKQISYNTIEQAITDAKSGETIEIVGAAVSEVTVETGIGVEENVTVVGFDGSSVLTCVDSMVKISNDGTVELMNGILTATPSDQGDVTVDVKGASVTAKEEVLISTENGGQVTTTTDTSQVVISPDGNPAHKVTYVGCDANTTYGVNSGELTTEERVEITAGTEYDLKVQLGTDETVIETSANNSGTTTITKGEDANGNDTIVIGSDKANDEITIGEGDDAVQYTTADDNTKIVIAEDSNIPIIQDGAVDVPAGGTVQMPGGQTVTNSADSGNKNVTVSSNGTVQIPDGGEATLGEGDEGITISVPTSTPANLPAEVTTNEDGSVSVTAKPGNQVTIDGEDYTIGDFDATFEVTTDGKGGSNFVVSDGSVVLQPGQSVTDSNGVTYTNPEGSENALELNMSLGQSTEVNVAPNSGFEYTLPGETKSNEYQNPGNTGSSFTVSPEGEVELGYDITLPSGNEVTLNMDGESVNIVLPEENQGNVSVDPTEGTITVTNSGDSVCIEEAVYMVTEGNTVLKPTSGGVELTQGGVALDANQNVIAGNTSIKNTGSGECVVSTEEGGNTTINVPRGGSFELRDPNAENGVVFENSSNDDVGYTLDADGNLEIQGDGVISFKQGSVETEITAGENGVKLNPTEDGVEIITPPGGSVTIDGVTYTASPDDELIIVVSPDGTPILVFGTTTLPDGGKITLPGGSVIESKGGATQVNADGALSVSAPATVEITNGGEKSSYTAVGGNVDLEFDPETGIPTLLNSSSGSVELGENSQLNVIYNTIAETEETFSEDQKVTFTNTGSGNPIVNADHSVEVPRGGSVSVVTTDSAGNVVGENVVSIPDNAQNDSVIMNPQPDGSVDVQLAEEDDVVDVNGMEFAATVTPTKIKVDENGATLEEGGVNLDGGKNPKESINVNGTNITNTGTEGSSLAAEKQTDGSVNLTADAGAQFALAIPGEEDSEVSFCNPGEEAEYNVRTDGSIVVGDGDEIGFTAGGKNQSVSGMNGKEIALEVTEDGVTLTAPAGGGININDAAFENAGSGDEELSVTVDKTGNIVLEEGTTVVSGNEKLQLPAVKDDQGNVISKGNTISATDGDITVGAEGNVLVPNGDSVSVTTPSGKINTYKAISDGVELDCESTTEAPVLISGLVEVPSGSSIKAEGTTYTNTGVIAPAVNADGAASLPSGSKLKMETVVSDGAGNDKEVETTVAAPESNTGNVDMEPNDDGSVRLRIEDARNKVVVDGAEYESTVAPTGIKVDADGATLEEGGVNLEGGKNPKESIKVNGINITNMGGAGSSIAVEKQSDGSADLTADAGAYFEMTLPGEEDSAMRFHNPGEEAEYNIRPDGSIVIGDGSKIGFSAGGKEIVVSGTEAGDVVLAVTEKGVEITAEPGEKIVIGGVTYEATGEDELTIVVDKDGKVIVAEGSAIVPQSETVYVENSRGELIGISKAEESQSADSIVVSAGGNIEASAGDVIQIGDGKYISNDTAGDFNLDLNAETGEIAVLAGENISVINGNVTIGGNVNGVNVSSNGNIPVTVVRGENGEKPSVTVPAGGNVTIGDKASGNEVEIVIPENASGDKEITISEEGDLSVSLEEGEQVTMGGIIYTAQQDGNIVVDGSTGALLEEESTIIPDGSDAVLVINPESFNKENYQYTVPGGESVMVGDTLYTAPSGGMVLSGNPDGNPIIQVNEAGESVQVGNETYTVGTDDTKFVVNSPNNVTLIDSDNSIQNSSLVVKDNTTIVIDGNEISVDGGTNGSAVVTKTNDGNSLDVQRDADVSVNIGTKTPVEVYGDEVTVNGTVYGVPSGGVIFGETEGGKTSVTINNAGETLQAGNSSFTAGNNNTQMIINGANNVTLVDNGNVSANSSLVVSGEGTLTVDGNTITSSGSAGAEYTITKSSDGDSIEVGEGTKLAITSKASASKLIMNEQVTYNEQVVSGNRIVITPVTGAVVVIDKTVEDENGNYISNITSAGNTVLTPVKDVAGNIIGFTTSVIPSKPSTGNSSTTEEEESEEEPEEETEEETEEATEEETEEEPEEEESEEEEDVSQEMDENVENVTDADDTNISGDGEEPDETAVEKIVIETVEQAENVLLTKIPENVNRVEVSLGNGKISIISEAGTGRIGGNLQQVLTACLDEEELALVQNGEKNVEIRLLMFKLDENVPEEEVVVIQGQYDNYKNSLDGLQMGTYFDVVVERREGNGDWITLHELNEEIEITMEIPEELVAEGRTYFVMRNHDGECTLLGDMDRNPETITFKTAKFSTYTILFTDADVSDVDIDVLNGDGTDGLGWLWWLSGGMLVLLLVLFIILWWKKKEYEEI